MDSVARSRYLNQRYVIAPHIILWDAITNPCLSYLLLSPKSPFDCRSSPQQIIMIHVKFFRASYGRWTMLSNDTSEKLHIMAYLYCAQDDTRYYSVTATIFLSVMTKQGLKQCVFNVKDIMFFLTDTLLSHKYMMQETDPGVHWSCVSDPL